MSLTRTLLLLVIVIAGMGLMACQPSEPEPPAETTPETTAEAPAAEAGVVDVILEDYSFLAPPRLRSGWTTFRMTNNGEQPHFMLFWRLPDDKTFDEYAAEVSQPFQEEFDRFYAGEVSRDEMLENVVGRLPEWFGTVEGMGGVGLTSPGRTAETSVLLEPGDYVMECYVISPEGKFHGSLGMLRPLIVDKETTGLVPPEADIQITLSNYEMSIEGEAGAGEHTIAVHSTENAEGLIGHDVHLARLEADTSLEELVDWMSWIEALRPPVPAEFLGGADHVAAGRTSYFTVTLEPGRYAWISEGFAAAGMIQEFVVE